MEAMKEMSDNQFDLAIVDPPYGIDASRMTMGRGSGNDTKKHDTTKKWDITIPSKVYFDEVQRVSKNQIIWGGNYFLDYLGCTRCVLIWDKKDCRW
jgi:site-specific DNA-methyltransferase (adenine-specific)